MLLGLIFVQLIVDFKETEIFFYFIAFIFIECHFALSSAVQRILPKEPRKKKIRKKKR